MKVFANQVYTYPDVYTCSLIKHEKLTKKTSHYYISNCALSLCLAMTQTAVMTVEPRMPWTLLHPSASSLWEWVKSTCLSTTTTTVATGMVYETLSPMATAPPHPRASPTHCRPGLGFALTLRKVVSPSMTPTLCDPCGRVT